ncbi:MAG: ABC transporter permease [Lachnospiraceae bacterium]|nr:ABC transporter permease [Lachnospiraceae bacterium]
MGKYVVKRLLTFIPMILLMSFLIYGGLELVPGDIITTMLGPDLLAQMTAEEINAIREAYGLNDPFILRYFRWLLRVLKGDWGTSLSSGVPVKDIILARLPVTMELALTGLIFSAIFGSLLGIISALHKGQLSDIILTTIGVIGQSIPQFFFGMVAILVFALRLKWLPVGGRTTPQMTKWYQHLRYLILPGLVLGLTQTASVLRYARSSMLESMNRDFVKTARSKGIPEWKVNLVHGFRVTMTPVIILIAFRLPALISTSIVIENVFQWPGIGVTFKDAVTGSNFPLVMMIALIIVIMVMFMSLLMDIFTRIIDPRVRLQ